MDLNDPRTREVFFHVHHDLPREGPGNRDCTARALALAGPLPAEPRILDIACGPGMQTLDLADLAPTARITAIEAHPASVTEARRRVRERGVADRVTVDVADMRALEFPDASFDLLWCEGAAYIMGVETALKDWRRLLTPGGHIAFSECVWLRDDVPEFLKTWWYQDYPDIGDIPACRALIERCGYEPVGDFVLPEAAWMDDYYEPMEERLARISGDFPADDPVAVEVLGEAQREIDYYRKYSSYYGYVFCVARKPAG